MGRETLGGENVPGTEGRREGWVVGWGGSLLEGGQGAMRKGPRGRGCLQALFLSWPVVVFGEPLGSTVEAEAEKCEDNHPGARRPPPSGESRDQLFPVFPLHPPPPLVLLLPPLPLISLQASSQTALFRSI